MSHDLLVGFIKRPVDYTTKLSRTFVQGFAKMIDVLWPQRLARDLDLNIFLNVPHTNWDCLWVSQGSYACLLPQECVREIFEHCFRKGK